MARYIDADALIDRIKRDVITLSKDAAECKEFMIEHIAMDWFAPTANVAPMEEVEKWKANAEQLYKEMSERMVEERKIERKLAVKKMRERLYRELAFLCAKDKFNKEYFLTEVDRVAKEMLEQNDEHRK